MRDDVERLYRAMDLFCLPSHREGFPRAAMEAAASGLPVVATDIRGCREVVDDPATGRLFPVGDVDALCARLRDLADPVTRAALGAASRAKAESELDERLVVARVLAAYARP
jgi:glycosyltransferase involved in cell wall biosynthesis